MILNSNKERELCWNELLEKHGTSEIEKALSSLKPDTRTVLNLHYTHNNSFKEIAATINRSITVIRNHHNRGIYKLYRYFNPHSSDNI